MTRSFLLALIPVAAIAGRLLAHIVDRVCPEGYECAHCGFMRGDHLDREIHMWLAHAKIAASGGASTPAPLSTPFGGTTPSGNWDDAEAAT